MSEFGQSLVGNGSPTAALAQAVASSSFATIPADIIERLQHSVLDWLGVAIAGAQTPQMAKLLSLYGGQLAGEGAAVVASPHRGPAETVALLNGFAGHVLDFDDVIVELNGHPSAVVVPAVLAAAEVENTPGKNVVEAMYAGFEAVCWLGLLFGNRHYQHGWHATSVLGALGATAAVSKLLGANAESIEKAMGLAASLASGVQGTFGSSGKPLQVGNAAASAIRASYCVRSQIEGPRAILECPGGLLKTHSAQHESFRSLSSRANDSLIRKIILKEHASCFGTHATIQAVQKLDLSPTRTRELKELAIVVSPQLYRACRIDYPVSGDEIKFSLRTVAALACLGIDTKNLANFRTELTTDARVRTIAEKIQIDLADDVPSSHSTVRATFMDGNVLETSADSDRPLTDLPTQWKQATAKFDGLCQDVITRKRREAIIAQIAEFASLTDVSDLMAQ